MKKSSALILQTIIALVGLGALVFLLWEPQIEGRNAHATLFQIYFHDSFLVYAYLASISFFVALYQAFAFVGYMGQGRIVSRDAMRALRLIRYCALSLAGFIVAAEGYLFIVRPGDDIAGGVFMGLLVLLVSALTAMAAAVYERKLQLALPGKARNS